ncbi:MAG: hypothetical protein J2P37_18950 [Ktedonobacteraceae bacterium]|nr:hypothetical protein [Ktedonobacteraceae bacterium]
MGIERAVTRWYVQRQSILEEIAQLEALLAGNAPTETDELGARPAGEILEQLAKAREQLLALGPCPKPMMG